MNAGYFSIHDGVMGDIEKGIYGKIRKYRMV